jgi:hypothetical protein
MNREDRTQGGAQPEQQQQQKPPIQTKEEFFALEAENRDKILTSHRDMFDDLRKNAVNNAARAGKPTLEADWTDGEPASVTAPQAEAANAFRQRLKAQETTHRGEIGRLLDQQKQARMNLDAPNNYAASQKHFELKKEQEKEVKDLLEKQTTEMNQFYMTHRETLADAYGGAAAFNDEHFTATQASVKNLAESRQAQLRKDNQDTLDKAQAFLMMLDSRTMMERLAQRFQSDNKGFQMSRPGATPETPDVAKFEHSTSNIESTIYADGQIQISTTDRPGTFFLNWLGAWSGSQESDIAKDMARTLSRVPDGLNKQWELSGHPAIQNIMRKQLIILGVDPKNISHVASGEHAANWPTDQQRKVEGDLRNTYLAASKTLWGERGTTWRCRRCKSTGATSTATTGPVITQIYTATVRYLGYRRVTTSAIALKTSFCALMPSASLLIGKAVV